MYIRQAELADIDVISGLEHSYMTDHVWQLSEHDSTAEYSALFRLARLPRQLQAPYPHDPPTLRRILHRCDHVWVMQGQNSQDISGYLGIVAMPWQNTGWITCFNVIASERRKGIGTELLHEAMAQAKREGLQSISVDLQTKNYPATLFSQARGFRFSGYSDNYYSARDIALFFAYRIR